MAERGMGPGQEVDEKFKTLLNNTTAARVVSQAIEGTIGPKGLDTMMVDGFGDVVITNDGVTILKLMEINHPAARMIINAARAQQEEIGDGTTTATIIAAGLIAEGTAQVLKGVPVTRVLEGISLGIVRGIKELGVRACKVTSLDDPLLFQVALVAGRGDRELADLVVRAASVVGWDRMLEPGFRFPDLVMAMEGANSEVLKGVIVNRVPINRDMPRRVEAARILVLDDALRSEELEDQALHTESGFKKYLELKEAYRRNLLKLSEIGINMVLVDRSLDDLAEEILTDSGIIAVHRVSHLELERVAEHTGARIIKRNALNRESVQLQRCLGLADLVEFREDLEHVRITGGRGQGVATILVGASTSEVVEERERRAKDAAASVQAALKGGVLPGGGAIEVGVGLIMEQLAKEVQGMMSYGVLCVKEALEKPFSCIAANAGMNPLEKLVEVINKQQSTGELRWGIDCDSGLVVDMEEYGVLDPALVKIKALQTAGEVATAVLRISTVIKKREVSREDGGY